MKFFLLFLFLFHNTIISLDSFSLITFIDREPDQERILQYIECFEDYLAHPRIDEVHVLYNYQEQSQENILLSYLKQRSLTIHFTYGSITFNDVCNIAENDSAHQCCIIAKPHVSLNNLPFPTQDMSSLPIIKIPIFEDGHASLENKDLAPGDYVWIIHKPYGLFKNNFIPLGSYQNDILLSEHVKQFGVTINCVLDLSIPSAQTMQKHTFMLHERIPLVGDKYYVPYVTAQNKENNGFTLPFLNILKKYFTDYAFVEIGTIKKKIAIDQNFPFKNNYFVESNSDMKSSLQKMAISKDKNIVFINECTPKNLESASYIPYVTEIELLKKIGLKEPIIIVSNASLFYRTYGEIKTVFSHYPSFEQLYQTVMNSHTDYRVICIDDLFIFFTGSSFSVSPLAHACTISRLYDEYESDCTLSEILKAETIISNASRFEKDALQQLTQRFSEAWIKKVGMRRHYPWWYGLIQFKNGCYKEAYDLFKEAFERGLTHWRVKWYMERAYSLKEAQQ